MKKFLLTIFLLVLFVPNAYAQTGDRLTVATSLKTTVIEDGHYKIDGAIYLPLIETCEALGAVVYKNNAEKYYIISRDADIIEYKFGDWHYTVNGTHYYPKRTAQKDSSGRVLAPVGLIEKSFCVLVTYGPGGAYINRSAPKNYSTGLITNLMKFCFNDDFYPENFKRYYRYYSKNPTTYPGTVIKNVNICLDQKYFEQAITVTDFATREVLVNKLNRLPENYSAPNLVAVDRKYAKDTGRSHQLNSEAYKYYVSMYAAAEKEGLALKIVSSYRTESYQRGLYNSYSKNYGLDYAEKYSARPGYSEHQTGLAADINSVYTTFENSKEYKWLQQHAHEYGFIERYPKGKEFITGYSYEPWHYRYVGVEAAKIIHEKKITYEEYYAKYVYKSPYTTDNGRTWANVIRYYHQ